MPKSAAIESALVRRELHRACGFECGHFCWRFSIMNAMLAAAFGGVAWHFFSGDAADPDRRFAILGAAGILFSVLGR